MINRSEAIAKSYNEDEIVFVERSIEAQKEIFLKANIDNLSETLYNILYDLSAYAQRKHEIEAFSNSKIVYLSTPDEVSIERVCKRDRPAEKTLEEGDGEKYLIKVNQIYNEWASRKEGELKQNFIRVNTTTLTPQNLAAIVLDKLHYFK